MTLGEDCSLPGALAIALLNEELGGCVTAMVLQRARAILRHVCVSVECVYVPVLVFNWVCACVCL